MNGSILQLVAKGQQDLLMVNKCDWSFFKSAYRRHSNFALNTYEEQFTSKPDFGSKAICNLSFNADLLRGVYLYIELPELSQLKNDGITPIKRSWVNSIGHGIIESVDLKIGGAIIDTIYSDYLELYSELYISSSKSTGYDEMVGKQITGFSTINSDSHKNKMYLYIPLPFSFSKDHGNYLPIVALQQSRVSFDVKFKTLTECYITDDESEPPLTNISFYASIYADYVFLDNCERAFFVKTPQYYLINQIKLIEDGKVLNKKGKQTIDIRFNHPIKELIWFFQRDDILSIDTPNDIYGNDWFNYSTQLGIPTSEIRDTFSKVKIILNKNDRTIYLRSKYLRLVNNYNNHTKIPNNYIYSYSFGLNPEGNTPKGSVNFSKINNPQLEFLFETPNVNASQYLTLKVFAINYNLLIVQNGTGGILYYN